MNIYKFYVENIEESDYFYKFIDKIDNEISMIKDEEIEFYDDDEIIQRFKEICEPKSYYTSDDNIKFILISYYLKMNNYHIEQFPTYFDKEIKCSSSDKITNFADNMIRNYLFENGKMDDRRSIPWAERRDLINSFIIKKDKELSFIDKSIDEKIKLISTRRASFMEMDIDERLEILCNLIENLLKKSNGKFEKINYSSFGFDFIDDNDVIAYRNLLQCFRHGSEGSLQERWDFNDKQKKFLVDYGILICTHIYSNK